MRISDDDLTTIDLDWYAVDELGQLGHFTTAGVGWVPESVCSSFEDTELVKHYFYNMADNVSEFELLYDNIPNIVKPNGIDDYVESYVNMAKKGLFSFDVSRPMRREFYSLIVRPMKAISINKTPEDIRLILSKTMLKLNLSNVLQVGERDIKFV